MSPGPDFSLWQLVTALGLISPLILIVYFLALAIRSRTGWVVALLLSAVFSVPLVHLFVSGPGYPFGFGLLVGPLYFLVAMSIWAAAAVRFLAPRFGVASTSPRFRLLAALGLASIYAVIGGCYAHGAWENRLPDEACLARSLSVNLEGGRFVLPVAAFITISERAGKKSRWMAKSNLRELCEQPDTELDVTGFSLDPGRYTYGLWNRSDLLRAICAKPEVQPGWIGEACAKQTREGFRSAGLPLQLGLHKVFGDYGYLREFQRSPERYKKTGTVGDFDVFQDVGVDRLWIEKRAGEPRTFRCRPIGRGGSYCYAQYRHDGRSLSFEFDVSDGSIVDAFLRVDARVHELLVEFAKVP